MKVLPLLVCLALLCSACSPALSPDITSRAERSITFEQLIADPDLYIGATVILGGFISVVTPAPAGTLVGVVQRPLDYWDKPIRTRRSAGRYLLYTPRPVDPLHVAPGREITVAAEVLGTRLEALGNKEFHDPVLLILELRSWELQRAPAGALQWSDPLYDRHGPSGRPE